MSNFNLIVSISESNIDIANNSSDISISIGVQAIKEGWGYSGYQTRIVLSGSVNDTIYIPSYNIAKYQYLPLSKTTYKIGHEENGAKSVSVSATWYSDGVVGTIGSSAGLTLTTIPRASIIGSVNFGSFWNAFSVSYTKHYAGFNCKLRISEDSTVLQIIDGYASGSSVYLSSAVQNSIMLDVIRYANITLSFVIETWNGSTKIGESSVLTKSISLPPANQISSVPNFDIDTGFTIVLSRTYPSYTSYLEINVGSTNILEMYITDTYKVSFTNSQLASIYKAMATVNSTSFNIVVTSYYSDRTCGYSAVMRTGSITNATPTFPGFSWETINHLTLHDKETIVKGYSNVKVNIEEGRAYKGASIAYYQISIGSKISKLTSLESVVSNCDGNVITVYIVDSRGNAFNRQMACDKFINYSSLYIENLSYKRGTGGIGSGVTISFNGFAWTGSFGLQENVLTAQYFYKEQGGSDWILGATALRIETNDKFSFTSSVKGDLGAEGFDSTKNFDLKVVVVDKLSSSSKEIILAKGIPAMAFGNGGVAFGGFYDESLTDVSGNPFPVQIYSPYFKMMIPCGVNVVDDEAPIKQNGTVTNLRKMKG